MNATSPIRALHVVGGMNRGGVETWLLHLVRQLDRARIQTDFLVHTDEPCAYDAELERLGCRILRCPHVSRPLRYSRVFRRLLREQGPYDVVHSHVHHFSGLLVRLARQAGVPVRIAHSHNDTRVQDTAASTPRRLYLNLMRHWIARHATDRLAASREAGVALFGTRSPWQVLYCAVDFAPFAEPVDRAATRTELGLPADAPLMVHVGRFAEQKNHAFLIRIAANVGQAFLPATGESSSFSPTPRIAEVLDGTRSLVPGRQESLPHVLLIGDGPLRESIERDVKSLGIADRVHFLGSRADVSRLLGAADVFLLPSLYEGLPLVGMEAQAAGLPILLTDTITAEVDIVPELVHRLPLSQGPAVWAERAVAAARSTPNRIRALEMARNSPFDIRQGARQLEACYARSLAAL